MMPAVAALFRMRQGISRAAKQESARDAAEVGGVQKTHANASETARQVPFSVRAKFGGGVCGYELATRKNAACAYPRGEGSAIDATRDRPTTTIYAGVPKSPKNRILAHRCSVPA